eukprot:gene5300-8918_t
MSEKHQSSGLTMKDVMKSVIAGGSAGIIEVLCMYPLDVVKTRTQLSTTKSLGVFQTLGNIVKEEGFTKLYRGITSPILAEAPKRAMKFTCNEIYKPIFTSKEGAITFVGSGAAGAMAGATETFVNCPFEVVKVRMQSKDNLKLYKNTMDAVVQIGKNEGILTLYKGFEAQLFRNAMWNGTYFALIPFVKNLAGPANSKSEELTKKFISGSIAGTIATTTNTPFDVVKSRIQNQIGKENPKYVWSIPSIGTVFKEEGIRALYKGYAARLYRLGPGGGIMIVAFDQISEWLKKYGF